MESDFFNYKSLLLTSQLSDRITIATRDLPHVRKELEKIKIQAHKHRLLGLHTRPVMLSTFNYVGLTEVKQGKSKKSLY